MPVFLFIKTYKLPGDPNIFVTLFVQDIIYFCLPYELIKPVISIIITNQKSLLYILSYRRQSVC